MEVMANHIIGDLHTVPASTNHKSTKVYLNAPDNATGWQSYNTLSLDGPWKHQITVHKK